MDALYPGDARYICDAFYIEEGEGEYYDLGQRPLLRVPFALGGGDRLLSARFIIGEDCIGCGTCAEVCPADCIEPGEPFRIQQEHCLRCGLCAETCPKRAIEKTANAIQGK